MRHFLTLAASVTTLAYAAVSVAGSHEEYSTKPSYSVALPKATTSFGTSADAFRPMRLAISTAFRCAVTSWRPPIAACVLQKNFGASSWLPVGTVNLNMDPCFIKISPDGLKIALGTGFYKPLYIFPTGALSVVAPPDIGEIPGRKAYDLSYYDAAWRDSRYLSSTPARSTTTPPVAASSRSIPKLPSRAPPSSP